MTHLRAVPSGSRRAVKDLRGEAERGSAWVQTVRERGVVGAAEEGAEGAEDPADEQEQDQDEDEGDGRGDVGLPGGEPGEEDGQDIFAHAEGDVGEGLGRGGDGGADGGFAAVSDEGDSASGKRGGKLLGGREGCRGLIREERGDRNADEGVERVPDEVEGGDLVGEELDGEEREAGGDDAPVGEQVEGRGQGDEVEVCQEAEGGHGGVDVEPGGEADRDQQGDEFVGREGHGDSIGARASESASRQASELAGQLSAFRYQLPAVGGQWQPRSSAVADESQGNWVRSHFADSSTMARTAFSTCAATGSMPLLG